MSKASEWTKAHEDIEARCRSIRLQNSEAPKFTIPYGDPPAFKVLGHVSMFGHLTVGGTDVDPAKACAFARWILDTFGEAP